MPRLIYTLYLWLAFVPIMLFLTLLLGLLCLLTAPFIGPRRAGRLYAVPWSRAGLALSGVCVEITGTEHVQPGESYVVVANHLSQVDIWVLYGYLGLDIRWVAKQEVRRIPVVGIACVTLGHIFIDRSHPDRAIASLNAAKEQVRDGTSIIFFPEGTRSRDGQLRPFKKGAFRMAADLDLPVLPIRLDGTREVLPPGTLRLAPGKVSLTILPPLNAPEPSDAGVTALMEATYDQITAARADQELAPV